MKITILTLFPEMFSGFITESIIGRAIKDGKVEVEIVNLRNWGLGKHHQVDDTPYGGGAGMVLRPDVVVSAIRDVSTNQQKTNNKQILYGSLKEIVGREYKRNFSTNEINKIGDSLINLFETLDRIEQKTKDEYENRRSSD